MGTRVPVEIIRCENNDVEEDEINDVNNNDDDNLRSADSYIEGNLNEEVREGGETDDRISDVDHRQADSLDHDEGSNTVDCMDESYKDSIQIRTVVVDDDRSSLESSGSLRSCSHTLTTKDVLPIESARARFLQLILDHFVGEHLIEKRGSCLDKPAEPEQDSSNKRKSGEAQYEGDPRFVLPLMYVANLYETLANEVNSRIAPLNGLRERTIGVALEASGGLYRKLTQKFPKTGSYSFKRRELATSLETRTRFPELVVQEEKRVRFVVANGLEIIEKPNGVRADDAEWFKRLTGRSEVAVTARDYKFYNPRHKVRRASFNASPTIMTLPSYPGSSDHDIHSVIESPREPETPSKQPVLPLSRQPQFEPVALSHHHSPNQNQQVNLLSRTHESAQPSHLPDIIQAHQSPPLSQNMGSLQSLTASNVVGHLSILPSSPAKFCDECGSPYLRPTSKFCSQCGTKRFGI